MNPNQLNEIRKNAGLSIEELSERANLPKSTVEKILFGVVKHPRIDTMQAIERALGLAPTFTDEERALGLSDSHAIVLSDKDRYRFHVLSRADEILGEEFVDAQIKLLEIATDAKTNK